MFRRFTFEEREALSFTTGKYRTAAKRLSVSVTAARNLWEATLAEYKRVELIGSTTKAGASNDLAILLLHQNPKRGAHARPIRAYRGP